MGQRASGERGDTRYRELHANGRNGEPSVAGNMPMHVKDPTVRTKPTDSEYFPMYSA